MIAKWLGAAALGAALWAAAAPIEAATKAGAPSCDRDCLTGIAGDYMAALLQARPPRSALGGPSEVHRRTMSPCRSATACGARSTAWANPSWWFAESDGRPR